MNRCDFSSISTCLKNHISESNQMSQPDFLYELFEDFMDDPANQDFSMDNGLVCRWLTGQAKISPKISAYYSKPSNQKKLAETIHQNLLPLMSDCNMAMQDIYTLFIQDDTISDAKKKNLASLYKPASSRLLFLAIHDWMNHFNPILNKYNAVKKKLKAKVSERKELNVQKDKTSILNPIQHIKLNQQLTTVTEEIEELKSRKEQLIFQAQCTTDKDMMNLSKKYDQMNKNLDVLDSQDTSLKKQLEKDATAFREEKFRPEPEQYTKLLDTRIQIRPDFRDKLIEQLKGTFGKYYDYHRRDIAANEVDCCIDSSICLIVVSSECTAIIPLSIRDNLTNDCIKKSNFSVCSKMVAISS